MKICFYYGAHENLGIEYLSAVLKAGGHEVTLVFDPMLFNDAYIKVPLVSRFFNFRRQIVDEILATDPDLIAFSVVTDDYQYILSIAREIKQRGSRAPIIFGGIHPTALPGQTIQNDAVDIICVGEGEGAILELADALAHGGIEDCLDIPNLWIKQNGRIFQNEVRPPAQDLDGLPFADKEVFYHQSPYFSKIYTIMTSRGCPYQCTYCCNNMISRLYRGKGKLVRQRSVENVLQELRQRKEIWGFDSITFYDDIFAFNKGWLAEFCREYKRSIGLPFRCILHPKYVDRDRAAWLKEAGCVNVELGIQSLNQDSRRQVLKRFESNAEIENAMRTLKAFHIGYSVDHILGIPKEGEEDQRAAARFYNDLRPDLIDTFWMTYYPKTAIIETAIENGYLHKSEIAAIEDGRGSSHAYAGEHESEKMLYGFAFLFGYLPFLPRRLVRLVIEKRWYRFFKSRSLFLSTVLPRLIRSFFWNDYNARNQMKRNFYLLWLTIKKKLNPPC